MTFPSLTGRKVLITGASSGVGRHLAHMLAHEGAAVVCAARRAAHLDDVVGAIRATGGTALAVPCDVTRSASIAGAFDAAEAAFGPIDSVICNAGIQFAGPALRLPEDQLNAILSVNLRGAFLTAREGARRMSVDAVPESRRRVVFIASILGQKAQAGAAVYAATKAGTIMLAKTLALEWSRRRIAVNAICPGYMETEILDEWFETPSGKADMARWPRGQFMDLAQLDAPLTFLLSEGAAGTTGNAIIVDEAQSLA
jgi:NAD(P)-dependent dehydrogenase (short-subunit alcohol dehydrogenase family)